MMSQLEVTRGQGENRWTKKFGGGTVLLSTGQLSSGTSASHQIQPMQTGNLGFETKSPGV